ncbi:hypothetical protein BJ322DRAFT_1195506 [Thelephora terrestris]|uniref:NACHT domain-containing protein n=1 Tax=Thelephora terrestris TaxID=56493 RepID=A0A9P6L6A7_9AGAM|nr:hypothetical protein BJ322DRAFT_1195506 [Thelephora terrestris]
MIGALLSDDNDNDELPFSDPTIDPTMSKIRETLRSMAPSLSTKRQLIDGTKIVLDIAKESADAFPPLKSCLGGITALIKHYEESKDVQEKLEDLIPWLTKLEDCVTKGSAGGSPEEAERRKELTRSLEDIEKQSQELLGKGRATRILDKAQDIGTVVKLVEQLRRAILLYQLSQQQSIDNQVTKLAISLHDLLKLRETAPGVKGQIESTLARLGRFNPGGSDIEDEAESKRRVVLLGALEEIKDKLRLISERSNAAGYRENDADVQAVCELAQRARDSVMEYQLAQQNTIYELNRKMIDSDEWAVLNSCRRAHGAGYQHGDRNGCLKGTRESVLNEIERWAGGLDTSPVFWLNGLAGTGKSAIAQTVAEHVFADGRLGASFFCSRGVEDRNDLHLIFPTLAFQLAQKYPAFRSSLIPLLRSNADVVHESLLSQMQRLIVEPLLSAKVPTVIVIDALDECKDEDPESAILLILGQLVSKIPKVKFFITSRPETHIMSGFRGPLLKNATDVFILHQVERSTVDNDIRLFFKHELSKLAHQRRTSRGWPTDDQVDSLCRRAAGFFVYAVATVKFLHHRFRRPSDRLEVIMASPEITVHEGQTGLKVYNSLDSLYASVLWTAFSENNADDDALARSVLSAVILVTNPLSPSAIADLMGFESDVVLSLLESVQSLLVLDEDTDQPTRPFHKSFPDFITDPSRCSDTRFYISPDLHADLVLRCLGLMDGSLKKNMFSIPDYALNSDVEGLRSHGETTLGGALVYACRSWYNHLVTMEHLISDVLSALRRFLETNFLFWLEVLSVLGVVGDAARALTATLKWLNEPQIKVSVDLKPLFDTAKDCLRFVTECFEVISESAPHIYHSALPLAPASSIIWKLYSQQISSVARVVTGIPPSWDSCTAIAEITFDGLNATWSPCGQYIATTPGRDIEVRDSTTLEISYVLKFPGRNERRLDSLVFSPNGLLMIAAYDMLALRREEYRRVVVWDIQTGVVIKELNITLLQFALEEDCGYQMNKRNELARMVHISLGNIKPCTRVPHEDQRVPRYWQLGSHWIHGESLYFVTHSLYPNSEISIREFQPTSTPSPPDFKLTPTLSHPVIQLFQVPQHAGEFSFSPASFHASFVTPKEVIIVDVCDLLANALLYTRTIDPHYRNSPGIFSPDGRLFACRTLSNDISVWKNTPTGYIPWSTVRARLSLRGFSFSPISTSILAWGLGGIQLLCPDNGVSLSTSLTPDMMEPGLRDHLVTSSTDGKWIAITRKLGCIVTILDALSGIPQYSINMGPEIQSIRLVDNTLLVLARNRLARWDLETGCAREVIGYALYGLFEADETRALVLYDVKSSQISHCSAPYLFQSIGDIRFSLCGSKLGLSCSGARGKNTRFMQVEIKGGEFGGAHHWIRSRWQLLALLPSYDGFHIGCGGRWVEDSKGRKVFWLPLNLKVQDVDDVVWEGNCLAFVNGDHKEPIIIQFKP